MNVVIVERKLRVMMYQIMTRANCGLNHVFVGKLFTLDDAKKVCKENGYNVLAIGDDWQVLE